MPEYNKEMGSLTATYRVDAKNETNLPLVYTQNRTRFRCAVSGGETIICI